MEYEYIIAIDPGGDGAVTILDQHGNCRSWLFKSQRKEMINDLPRYIPSAFIIIEDVHSIYGVAADTNFAFGRNLGHIEGIIEALGGSVHARVVSYDWQNAVTNKVPRPFTKNLSEAEKKKAMYKHKKALKAESVRAALLSYPKIGSNHDGVADSVNIGRYAILVLQGKIVMAVKKAPVKKKKAVVKKKEPAAKKPASKKVAMPMGY